MKYAKKMMFGLVLIVLIAMLASCSGSSGDSAGETADNESGGKPYEGQELVVVGWGGALQDAQREAIFKPFEEEYGVTITEVSPTDYSTVTAMCQNGNIEYDVVNVQPDYAIRMKDYLEPIDYNIVDNTDFDEAWYNDYYVASDLYITAIVYNTDSMQDKHPTTWAEVWDTTTFLGKRTFWNYPTGTLEAALLADGVEPDQLYPLDVDRAFKSLDKIKPEVAKWWDTGAESIQLITNNEASVGCLWGSRVDEAKSQGQAADLEFNESIVGADAWVVPKGTKKKELAMEFISFATRAEQMAEFMKLYPNGSVNLKAYDLLDKKTLDGLATNPEKVKNQILMNDEWWVENGDEVVSRFTEWLLE